MKTPPHRKFLLRLSEQLGHTAWQKSVPPLSLWGGRGRLRWECVCSPVWWDSMFLCFCWCGPVNASVSTYVHSAPNLELHAHSFSTMKSTHFKSCPHPSSWSRRRSLVVRVALPPSRLSVCTLWPWRVWSSGRLLHGRGTAAIILSRRRIDCQYFFQTGRGGQLTKIHLRYVPYCNSSEQIHGKGTFCLPLSDASRHPVSDGIEKLVAWK